MSNQSLSELLTDLRPTLKDATGLGIIATMTIAAMATLGPQIATVGLGAALTQFLGGMFGDTIAGPAMDQLLKRDNGELEEAIKQLEAGLTSNSELRADIAQLLKQQEVYTRVTGVALQYHENRIVERLMRAIAAHQEFNPADVVTALNNAYSLDKLHPEVQYLTNLIKDLKHNNEGLWDEYIALKIQAQKKATALQDDDLNKLSPAKRELLNEPDDEDTEQDHTDDADLEKHETIWEIIDKHPRFVLLGEPGAGKTTTIRHLALKMALDRLANPDDAPIPMMLLSSVWDDNLSLDGFIYQSWRMVANPFGLMSRGDMVMFIDGLNEMGEDRSSKVQQLKDWVHGPRAPKRIIVTCREDDYTEDLSLDLPQVFTEPMDEDRIEAFVCQYLGNDADAFFQAMTPRHSELANNPYLLRALTIVYKLGGGNELPANDGQLLKQFVRSLWKREYDANTPGWRDLSEVAPILASLAYDMLDQKLAKGVDIAYVDGYMDAPLRQIFVRANFLAEENYKVRFYHQLMQEYFASLELIRRATIPRVQSPRFSGYTGHRVATDWDEVILAAGSLTDNADKLVKDVARRDIWLAAECIVKGAKVGLMTRRSIKKKLLNHINAENTVKRTESLRLYWQLAGKEARPYMLDKLNDPSSRVRRLAVRALAEMPDSEVISRIISLIDDKDVQVRETVTKVLQKSNIDSEYIHHVVDYLRSEDSSSRLAAFKLITQADPKSAFPHALSLTNDRDPQVRREVGRFIKDYYSPQVVRFLLNQSGDVSPDVKDKIRDFLKAPDLLAAPQENMLKLLQQMSQQYNYAALKQYVYSSSYFIIFGEIPDDVPILRDRGLHLLKTLRKHPTFRRIDASDQFVDNNTIRVMIISDPNEEALAVAKAMLAHPDSKVRYRSLRALGQLRDERFVSYFLTMMADNNEQVVGHALISMAENNAPKTYNYALTMLEQNLATGGSKYARHALRFIQPSIGWLDKEIRPYLTHANKQVRLMGLLILVDCNHPDALSIAAEMLCTEDSGHVIHHAIRALADTNHITPEIRSEIRHLITHKNSQVRMAALRTLHELNDAKILDMAYDMMEQETNLHVQVALLRILSEADAHEAIPLLKEWMCSEDTHKWGNARKIIIERDDFATLIEDLLVEGNVKRATKIIEYLITNGEVRHIEPLETLNVYEHSRVAKRVREAIKQIRNRLEDV